MIKKNVEKTRIYQVLALQLDVKMPLLRFCAADLCLCFCKCKKQVDVAHMYMY